MSGKTTDFWRRLPAGATPLKIMSFPARIHLFVTTPQTWEMRVLAPLGTIIFKGDIADLQRMSLGNCGKWCELRCGLDLSDVPRKSPTSKKQHSWFFTDFSNTQCLQWFVEGIVWFENPLYESDKIHRTTSDWTVYNGAQIEVNTSRSAFRIGFVLRSSERLLYSFKVLINECGRG